MSTWSEIDGAIREARATFDAADAHVMGMARLLQGRLRAIKPGPSWDGKAAVLRALKRELQDFNAVTGEWKEKP